MKILLLILLSVSYVASANVDKEIVEHLKKNTPTLIYEIKGFKLDPLLQEKSKNIYINRLYFKPIFNIDARGDKMSSTIIKSHVKLSSDFGIQLKLRDDIKFGDGSSIQAKDIEATIKRLMLSNKNQLNFIRGSEKLNQIEDKIEGLQVVSNREIKILYKEPIKSPFGWLTSWELGIVKSDFVNSDGSINGTPPPSGKWSIESQNENLVTLRSSDKTISILEIKPNELIHYAKYVQSNHLMIVDTGLLSRETLEELNGLDRFDQVGSRMVYITIKPKESIFQDKRLRQFVAHEVRNYIRDTGYKPQGSIVPKIEKEFWPLEKLKETVPEFSPQERQILLKKIKSRPIELRNISSLCYDRVKNTLEKLGASIKFGKNPDIDCFASGIPRGEAEAGLNNFLIYGKVPLLKPYLADDNLQSILHSGLERSQKINQINKYLFKESVIAVINHGGIAHFTSKKTNINKHMEKVISIEEFFFN